MLVRGWPRRRIHLACSKAWGISRMQAKDYVAKVHRRWEAECHRERAATREHQIRRLMRVYRRADADGDLAAVLDVETLLMKIEGTAWRPSDDLPGAGDVDIMVERTRNPDVAPPPDLLKASRKKRRGRLRNRSRP